MHKKNAHPKKDVLNYWYLISFFEMFTLLNACNTYLHDTYYVIL
nr:MAG TPA: hypothetical protein [Caudoviricetes sp.]